MMQNTAWLVVVAALIAVNNVGNVDAFVMIHNNRGGRIRSIINSNSALQMSAPNSWENDDFLESLGGGEPKPSKYDQNESVERKEVQPNNNLTDEEITEMAMRSAQYYDKDVSLEEAYGVPMTLKDKLNKREEIDDEDTLLF